MSSNTTFTIVTMILGYQSIFAVLLLWNVLSSGVFTVHIHYIRMLKRCHSNYKLADDKIFSPNSETWCHKGSHPYGNVTRLWTFSVCSTHPLFWLLGFSQNLRTVPLKTRLYFAGIKFTSLVPRVSQLCFVRPVQLLFSQTCAGRHKIAVSRSKIKSTSRWLFVW